MQLYATRWESPDGEQLPNGRTRGRQPLMGPLLTKNVSPTEGSYPGHSKNCNEYQRDYNKKENHLYIEWTLQPGLSKNCDDCKRQREKRYTKSNDKELKRYIYEGSEWGPEAYFEYKCFIKIEQSNKAKTFEDTLESDIDKNEQKSEAIEELDKEEIWLYKVISEASKVDHFRKSVDIYYRETKHTIFERLCQNGPNIQLELNYYKEKMRNLGLYIEQLTHLDQLIKIQIVTIETENLRSQQYQDNIAANIDHQPKITKNIRNLRLEKNNLYNTIRLVKENHDISQINHFKYAELVISACYTNSCSVYYQ